MNLSGRRREVIAAVLDADDNIDGLAAIVPTAEAAKDYDGNGDPKQWLKATALTDGKKI
ncbi:MAG: hypothetical protein ACRD4O_16455 [Bryobacteraceae bacterium]